jgi:hypothetical protein
MRMDLADCDMDEAKDEVDQVEGIDNRRLSEVVGKLSARIGSLLIQLKTPFSRRNAA